MIDFFSAWRPLIGWVGIVALTFNFVIVPMIKVWAAFYHPTVVVPMLDVSPLIGLVTTLLGMGSLRTIEKITEVHDKH